MIIYTKQSSGWKRKKASKKLLQARKAHDSFLNTLGIVKTGCKPAPEYSFPDLSVKSMPATSDNLYNTGGFKRTVDDWKWRKERQETAETIKEIERKKTRTAPIWNKGSYQYITDGEDTKTLGRKI